MAESMFKEAPVKASKKTWRTIAIGAVVPIAMFAAAPAVSAAETDRTETVNSEQVPGLPLPVPGQPGGDDQDDLVTLLGECVAALVQTVIGAAGDAPVPAEQLPATDTLQPCLDLLGALGLPVDLPDLPVDVPLPLPKEQ